MSVESFKTSKRNNRIFIGGSRISARTSSGSNRTPFSFNSISSINGIPFSVEAGAEIQSKEEWRRFTGERSMRLKSFIVAHPITVLWCIGLPLIGAIIQLS